MRATYDPPVAQIGSGTKVFQSGPVTGILRVMSEPQDVLDLMDSGAEGSIVLVADAGATFLAPLYHELTAIICTSGTVRSHIGIVSREFQIPCVMGATFEVEGQPPDDGTEVTLDCSGELATIHV